MTAAARNARLKPQPTVRDGCPYFALVAALSVCLLAAPCFADAGTVSAQKAEAKAHVIVGYKLFDEGRYDEAIAELEKAEQIYHAPTVAFAIGKAWLKKGDLLAARAQFQKVAGEALAANASRPFHDALARANEELATLDLRIPTLEIHVKGDAGRSLIVLVENGALSPLDLGRPIYKNPGKYSISVTPLGGTEVRQSVELVEGSRELVTIGLPEPVPVKAPPPVPKVVPIPTVEKVTAGVPVVKLPARVDNPLPVRGPEGSFLPAILSFGVGAVGFGVGAGTGIATLIKATEIKAGCNGTKCRTDALDAVSSANSLAAVSTASFVFAGLGAAGGVTLLIFRTKDGGPAQAGVRVGPGTLIISGIF